MGGGVHDALRVFAVLVIFFSPGFGGVGGLLRALSSPRKAKYILSIVTCYWRYAIWFALTFGTRIRARALSKHLVLFGLWVPPHRGRQGGHRSSIIPISREALGRGEQCEARRLLHSFLQVAVVLGSI